MTELRYLAPDTLDEAVGAFAKAGSAARILAGGTDLLVQMRSGVLKPGVIVDIKKIPEMTAIEQTADGGFRIGAAVSGMALAEHKNFGKVWPGVLEAVNLIGSKQVQGRASAGGHLCSRRSRCGGADGAAGRRRRKSADRLKARRRRAGESSQRLFRRLPSDRRQARHHRLPHQGGQRAAQAHRRDCRPTRNPEKLKFGNWFMAKVHVTTTINGEPMEFLCEPSDTMLDALRGPLALTGSKEGCASGDCGACSITLDDRLICSCLMLAVESEGHEIRTIEGMANGEKLHPLQQKFLEMAALQCGICTSGMLVASDALLKKNPDPSEEEVRFWLAGILFRCTGYDNIVRAVMETATELRDHYNAGDSHKYHVTINQWIRQ